MLLKSHIQGIAAYVLIVVGTVAGADFPPQQESSSLPLADWGYILRGALFIFASALAMAWIGRKISRRQK
ncbi:hypothetical protein BH20ACI2_BH20ACI2_19630 [soil metagenome]